MKKESIVPVNIDMFLPEAKDRLPQTNFQLALLMKDYWGRGSLHLYQFLKAGGTFSDSTAYKIDEHFFSAVRRHHLNQSDQLGPLEFYLQNQKHAKEIPQYYTDLVPEVEGWELKNEISMLSDRPADLFWLVAQPNDNIDLVLAYEAHRHMLLSHISAMISARTLNGRLNTRLSDIQRALNRQLFVGPIGSGRPFTLESIHDDESNRVIGFPDQNKNTPLTGHLKRTPLTVRQTKSGEVVHTNPRKKDDRIAMIKSIVKAKSNGGVIDIDHLDHGVLDPIGMIFASMDDAITPQQLADCVVSVIQNDFSLKISKVEDDPSTGTDHGQSPEPNFSVRKKVQFADLAVPAELVFYDRETFLNSKLEVGIRSPETGLYQGRAHTLLEIRRAEMAVSTIFPPAIYPEDPTPAFINRSKLEAEELRSRYKAA